MLANTHLIQAGVFLPHFTDEKTEALRGEFLKAADPWFKLRMGVCQLLQLYFQAAGDKGNLESQAVGPGAPGE